MLRLKQTPEVGEHKLFFRGDTVLFTLKLSRPLKGKAFVRTNIGKAQVQRNETILQVKEGRSRSAQDWHDIPMLKVDNVTFSVKLALLEVGHFEAMSFFFPDNATDPVWAGNDNVCINVEPSEYCCANSIYCAFPRQFGPNKYYPNSIPIKGLTEEKMLEFDKEGFTVIPPSGTLRDLKKELDFIINTLNCRIIHLLPINPTPTVFARMGRYGSPYAALDFTNIDPSLIEFDEKATPLEQFLELVDEIHSNNAKLIIDVAINHVGWAAKIHEEYPEWLVRKKDKSIVSPGAWGVTWGDLTELDHNKLELWEYLAEMFLIWAKRGVDGFRCDAGYMIPSKAWQYIISKIRNQYPDIIFLLEGLGGDPDITFDLLNKANMNWAYSELFQNYNKSEIQSYISKTHKVNSSDGLMVHYAETHDNNRLAATSEIYAKMRTGLCAFLASSGAFGITNGVEWYAKEKVDVHMARALNWGSERNQVSFIARINSILISHPVFYWGASIRFLQNENDRVLSFLRKDQSEKYRVIIIINLDCKNSSEIRLKLLQIRLIGVYPYYDLITERVFMPKPGDEFIDVTLEPGEILCLSSRIEDLKMIREREVNRKSIRPDKIDNQRAQAMALDIIRWKTQTTVISGTAIGLLAENLLNNPLKFCESVYPENFPAPLVHWEWPKDLQRQVMIPYQHMIMISSPCRFRASIVMDDIVLWNKDSLVTNSGTFFAVFALKFPPPETPKIAALKLSVYKHGKCEHNTTEILLLPKGIECSKQEFSRKDIIDKNSTFLDVNGRGGMLRIPLNWGQVYDRYSALLAANLEKNFPVDRQIMFNRGRAWIVRQGRSEELSIKTIEKFLINSDGSGTWRFHVPVGNGLYVYISLTAFMLDNKNAIKIEVFRHPVFNKKHYLADKDIVHFIFRPDIEDRNFHGDTVLDDDLKKHWINSTKASKKGVLFSPDKKRTLAINTTRGKFIEESEFTYSVYRKAEDERGFDPHSDLFSPGYFHINLAGAEHAEITAQVLTSQENRKVSLHTPSKVNDILIKTGDNSFENILIRSLKQFVVKRDSLKTVIAGYPWFLDWGRDTLICVRGLIAAEMFSEVKEILLQFAKYLDRGKLPNTIHGDQVGNWDTSDAPLWLIVVANDYCKALKNNDILNVELKKNKTFLDALKSIAENYIMGTSNGIKVDPESKLVFSPSHFTWMDTNFPAGTPREGYPIEIQALWYAALTFLESMGQPQHNKWGQIAQQVKNSIKKYFVYEKKSDAGKLAPRYYLSDCLHCSPNTPASKAVPDDHVRPNQLLAITLGAVTDFELSKAILQTSSHLLVPGAIRSLCDRQTSYELPIYREDNLLNDPIHPYWGRYEGPEDTKRKPAYHNGTAWTWLFPAYSEAYYMVYGNDGLKHAISILSSSKTLLDEGCIGHIPEIVDGNYPHKQRGCDAQAWGITELYRVWKLLH